MNKRTLFIIIGTIILAGSMYAGVFYYDNLRGIWPSITSPSQDITTLINESQPLTNTEAEPGPAVNNTDFPLTLPDGFAISIFAKDLADARVIEMDGRGNMWVSQHKSGTVTRLDINDGVVTGRETVFSGLQTPHGLEYDAATGNMYLAERNKISVFTPYENLTLQKIVDLPNNDGHNYRVIALGPDEKLYGNLGSSCNVCEETDDRIASVYSVNTDGSDFSVIATGTRNAAFLEWFDGKLWATENGRDRLGDDVPPDEVNVITEGKFYGWPFCFGKRVVDTTFAITKDEQESCDTSEPSVVDIQAHSAPLGLEFVPESAGWHSQYTGNLIVAYHGSWNRTEPTGYKLVRMVFENGEYIRTEDFISGWLKSSNDALGRPVDVFITDDGILYVSDDKAGVVYRITYGK